jgi:hypothetical protein
MCADERGNGFYLTLRARCLRAQVQCAYVPPLLSRRSYPSLHGRGGFQTQPPDGVLMRQTMGSNRAPHHAGQRPAHHAGQRPAHPGACVWGVPRLSRLRGQDARAPRRNVNTFCSGQCNPKNYPRRSPLHHVPTAHAQPRQNPSSAPAQRCCPPPTAWITTLHRNDALPGSLM